jgi:hypothetical protein
VWCIIAAQKIYEFCIAGVVLRSSLEKPIQILHTFLNSVDEYLELFKRTYLARFVVKRKGHGLSTVCTVHTPENNKQEF